MRTTMIRSIAACSVLLVAVGCAPDGEAVGAAVSRSSDALMYYPTGFNRLVGSLTGTGLNGRSLAGTALEDRHVVSISLDGVALRGSRPQDLSLHGTSFGPARAASRGRSVATMEGALFTATLDDGTALMVRVDAVERGRETESRDLLLYTVLFASADGWQPLCGLDDAGQPVLALPLAGRWDYGEGVPGGGSHVEDERVFTFGCVGAVLAKCVEMGYRPWAEGLLCDDGARGRAGCERITLAAHHQACTRMLRADYCGDGLSHTEDDVLVNAYDGLGIRLDSEDWPVEAEWDEAGALCVRQLRTGPGEAPACWDMLRDESCGAPERFAEGTLLVTETQPHS